MDSNGRQDHDSPFSPWQQANLPYKEFTPILALALLVSSVQQKDRVSGYTRDTLPDLAESASSADAGLVGLLPLCPL